MDSRWSSPPAKAGAGMNGACCLLCALLLPFDPIEIGGHPRDGESKSQEVAAADAGLGFFGDAARERQQTLAHALRFRREPHVRSALVVGAAAAADQAGLFHAA